MTHPRTGEPLVRHPGSFRDPNGSVLLRDGELLRRVNQPGREPYDQLMRSGLYERLASAGRLIPHEEVEAVQLDDALPAEDAPYRLLRPRRVRFISYPYEWCFSQLKDAALLTLAIQREALGHGMSLKDASAFNIAFEGARPVFIDTLSFEAYVEGQPWVAYGQFCRHFLAPLALMAHRDVRLSQLLRSHLDGIPLDLAASLLPRRTRLRFGLGVHLHLHARMERKSGAASNPQAAGKGTGRVGKRAMVGLIDSLESAVKRLEWSHGATEWGDYYDDTNYTAPAMQAKLEAVSRFIQEANPSSVWDLGANTGRFSRLASDRGIPTLALDIDPLAVERNYLDARRRDDAHLLPLWMDLADPSPSRGWGESERQSLSQRGPADLALALALVHHLAIGGNVPLPMIAEYLARIARRLVIEWVPKHDSQVARLFVVRKDVFDDYHEQAFQAAFQRHFTLEHRQPIPGSERALYLLQRSDGHA